MLELNKLYNMGGGLHVGSLYAYVRRYACRVRRSLFSSGLEREQRRKI